MPTPNGGAGSLGHGHVIAKIPVRDLDRAQAWYRDKLGLEAVERRPGGLRYCCASGEFHLFLSAGAASGTATQMGFEVEDIAATVAELRGRGVIFESDDVVDAGGNYPSKGSSELGTWFRDCDGNVFGLGQATG
jgi:catechol 2,3-dioxygenase-like lactoylglutathione lyase family enzyme